jgi:hypothetical protein
MNTLIIILTIYCTIFASFCSVSFRKTQTDMHGIAYAQIMVIVAFLLFVCYYFVYIFNFIIPYHYASYQLYP